MAGDVGAVALLLSQIFGFAVDPDGYEQLKRENKLKLLARGLNDAIEKGDWAVVDAVFDEFRELRQQTGP